jgi:hypothetical protein
LQAPARGLSRARSSDWFHSGLIVDFRVSSRQTRRMKAPLWVPRGESKIGSEVL